MATTHCIDRILRRTYALIERAQPLPSALRDALAHALHHAPKPVRYVIVTALLRLLDRLPQSGVVMAFAIAAYESEFGVTYA